MSTPIFKLFELNSYTLDLDMVQSWISNARIYVGNDQEAQLGLDRCQIKIDKKRKEIEETKFRIASYN